MYAKQPPKAKAAGNQKNEADTSSVGFESLIGNLNIQKAVWGSNKTNGSLYLPPPDSESSENAAWIIKGIRC